MDIDTNVKASTKSHSERPSEYYRRMRPEYFSDSEVIYEVPLTEELFDVQMDFLSTKKLQSAFEPFIVDVAMRLITPNIRPQTGPDGGGDGKVVRLQAERSAGVSIIQHWKQSEIENVSIPLLPMSLQQKISAKIRESFALRAESKRLLDLAKHAVELAIEQGEDKTMEAVR